MNLFELAKPTLTQVKWTALTLAIFFSLVSSAQYWFVQWQTKETLVKKLYREAQSISKQINYTAAPDLAGYNKAYNELSSFQLINNQDGTVIDTEGVRGAYAPSFLLRVRMPWLKNSVGQPSAYISPLGEHWQLLTIPISGGYGVIGISEFDPLPDPSSLMLKNAKLFPSSVNDIDLFNSNAFDNGVYHAIVAHDGRLLSATGRIPFQVDPMTVGQQSSGSGETREDRATTYVVLYVPVKNTRGTNVGTIIAYQDMSQEQEAIGQMKT